VADSRFQQEVAKLVELHNKKQADYGRDNDPFANVRASAEWGIPPWVGALVRAGDKFKRLQKAARGGTMANESVLDSFDDLAVYAIIGKILYLEGEQEEPKVWKQPINEIPSRRTVYQGDPSG
jgi:hypothetical protein